MPALPTLDRTEQTALSLAAASTGVRHLLDGPPAPARPLGTSAGVTWLEVDGYVLALSGPNPIRPPNGVVVADLDSLPQSTDGWLIGNGRFVLANGLIEVSRWWDPRPVLGAVSPQALSDISSRATGFLGVEDGSLAPVIAAVEDSGRSDAALALLGKGPGLTPEGDDLVIGLLAGLKLLGESVGAPGTLETLNTLAPTVTGAHARTTALSATLLRHAFRGEVSAPLGGFLQALTGHEDLEAAVDMLRNLGATSGMAMGRGALAAARHLSRGGSS
ncbi:MAG: DUF2877 domain-containing protein [Acidimicrobiia bacterium]|jgi:hypothetical protein